MSDDAETYHTVIATPEGLRDKFVIAYRHAEMLLRNGDHVELKCAPAEETITAAQRRFFHGPVLAQISEQAMDNGQRYVAAVWKRYFKNLILERKPRYEMVKLPGQKRKTPRRKPWSTEELGPRRYSDFIDEVIAHAATEWNVSFVFKTGERESVRYVSKRGAGRPN